MAVEIREGKLPRAGFDLHYRVYGRGPSVLVLAGGPGFDCDYLEPVARELSSSNSTVLVELRGTGRSRPPSVDRETVSLKLYLADLEALRDVAALVLAGAGPVRQALVGAMLDNISLRLSPEQNAAAGSRPSLQAMLPAYFFDPEKAAAMIAGFREESFHADVAQLLAADEMAPGMDLRPALRRLSLPALVIAGRQDPMDPAMQYEIHLALRKARLVLLDRCGHYAWLEQPELFYMAIRKFLGTAP